MSLPICARCKESVYEVTFFDDGTKPDGYCRVCKYLLTEMTGKRIENWREFMEEDKRDLVEFKSVPEFFEKERSGKKPNTERFFEDDTDERLTKLDLGLAKRIRITNTDTKEAFERTITDITRWPNPNGEDLIWVISWLHRGGL